MRGTEFHVEFTVTVEGIDGTDLTALTEVVNQTVVNVLEQFPDVTCYVKDGIKERM